MNQTSKLVEALEKIEDILVEVSANLVNKSKEQVLVHKAFLISKKAVKESQALESYNDGWVSVEERLPEPCSDVICFTLGGYGVESLLFDGDRKFYTQNTDVERNPTHWQPLPTPPQTTTI